MPFLIWGSIDQAIANLGVNFVLQVNILGKQRPANLDIYIPSQNIIYFLYKVLLGNWSFCTVYTCKHLDF